MPKKIIAVLFTLMLLSVTLLSGCQQSDSSDGGASATTTTTTTTTTTIHTSSSSSVFDPPKSSSADLSKGDYVAVSSLTDAIVLDDGDTVYVDPLKSNAFSISGFPCFKEYGKLYRLDYGKHTQYSAGIDSLAWNTSGGKIRFRTNAKSIRVLVTIDKDHTFFGFDHMTLKGLAGLDAFVGTGTNRRLVGTASLSGVSAANPQYTAEFYIGNGVNYQEVTLELPLYAGVKSIVIAFKPTDKVCEATPYTYEKPVVFYGHSITQGGCASRPGNAFANLLSRSLDFNLVNLGFSGSAHGEQYMAEFIGNLEMSAFVMDYDHNSDFNELAQNHYPFYKTVRDLNPDVPIIFLTKTDVAISDSDENHMRRELIKATYDKAVKAGDKNVYFVSGEMIYGEVYRDYFMVDGCHPNDAGMLKIAEALYPVLKEVLTKS